MRFRLDTSIASDQQYATILFCTIYLQILFLFFFLIRTKIP